MALRIFPHLLVRYAGMPLSVLQTAQLTDTTSAIEQQWLLEQQLHKEKAAICDLLYDLINQSTDPKERVQLLQLKRDIFNDKLPAKLPAAAPPSIHAYVQLILHKKEMQQLRSLGYDQLLIQARHELQQYARQESLRKGILLSSPVLYEQLNNFAVADCNRFRSKELKNEYSLVRYVSRMAAKTSPFSTFTYVGRGAIAPAASNAESASVHSSVRLHNGLFSYLRLLMIYHPVLNEIVELRLNVTATLQQEEISFLVNYFNVEAFQRLPARNLPLWLYHYFKEHIKPVSIGALTDHLCTQIPDTDRAVIKSFLLKLVINGLLEPHIGCAAIDPEWDRQLMNFLLPYRQLLVVASLHTVLVQLQLAKTAYVNAPSDQRFQLLRDTSLLVNEQFLRLQQQADLPDETTAPDGSFELFRFQARKFLPQDIFYEDTYTTDIPALPEAGITPFIAAVSKLCILLQPFDGLQEERQSMLRFFTTHYEGTASIPVTRFYHDYYRQEKKPAAAAVKQDRKDIPLPDTLQLTATADEIQLTPATDIPAVSNHTGGVFAQLYKDQHQYKGVVNAVLPGMGKVAGRFLHLMDPVVTSDFRAWNTSLHENCLLLELNDGSAFNANIHPPLLSYEVCMPGGNNSYAEEGRISLQDIVVRYDADNNALMLFHTGYNKVVYAYDLSLESFYNRSHFYRLLAHFNTDCRVPLRALMQAVDNHYSAPLQADNTVIIKPRICFGDHVILRRKGWLIRTAAIPVSGNEETSAAYFERLNTWRISNGVPEQVFLFLRSAWIPPTTGQQSQLQRDDYKPQYISFTHPLLVSLFRKVLSRAGEWCYLEEMLPDAAHVAADGGLVKEYLIHWYNM
ncbi:lantibiotic dehydratase [Chitinophaga rhizophila]|uniref:Lantibiotic dehydratase family protein n=1 Tax=Chitinophaga rhizophila TaxID=2866212 RepID=A0ABS7G5M9_9BACT|nr:lantibiotic dehydratase [Chitinophaga rhizophila]MBW8682962.1 lantibiotic dehydratase family protein [Chitinophaga rhizophila]